jgi:hypothetical protein
LPNIVNKFYCERCNEYVFAEMMDKLAERLNYHNTMRHPDLYAKWTPEQIRQSRNYEAADAPPAYLAKHSRYDNTDWGTGKTPDLTPEDRTWLTGLCIRWD